MTHRLNLLLLLLALAFGLPYYWLLLDNPDRDVAPQPIHLADLRRLADSLPGERPQAITVTLVGWDRTPGTLLAAGSGIKRQMWSLMSFRLDVPGGGGIVIDTGSTGQLAAARHVEAFWLRRQRLVDADMRAASLIVPTDESPETLGGLAAFARTGNSAMALTRARLNPAQIPAATRPAGLPWPDQFVLGSAVAPGRPQALAPGVVVVPTGAPTPGSQMVYVRLASGDEYVFAGPVAPYLANFTDLRTRARVADWFAEPVDRPATMRWLVTLRQWQREAPGLRVIPGHDLASLSDPKAPTGIAYRE